MKLNEALTILKQNGYKAVLINEGFKDLLKPIGKAVIKGALALGLISTAAQADEGINLKDDIGPNKAFETEQDAKDFFIKFAQENKLGYCKEKTHGIVCAKNTDKGLLTKIYLTSKAPGFNDHTIEVAFYLNQYFSNSKSTNSSMWVTKDNGETLFYSGWDNGQAFKMIFDEFGMKTDNKEFNDPSMKQKIEKLYKDLMH